MWLSKIRSHADIVRPYPDSMREIPCDPFGAIRRRSFFPGGSGAFSDPREATPDIMLVGNDFGTFDEDYVGAVEAGEESLTGTWAGVIDVLTRAKLDLSRIFFTNAIMGARARPPNRGPSPGLKDRAFATRCAQFLRLQITTIRPVGIVMLGKEQTPIISMAMPSLSPLNKCSTWQAIDDAGLQFQEVVQVPEGPTVRFCALMHPCMRASNMVQHGRRFAGLHNDAAELELLSRVTTRSG